MRSLGLLLTLSLSNFAAAYQHGHRDIFHDHFGQDLHKRNIVYNGAIADSYDFIIVGGGTAGLALASRLSEDSNTTVLVLEAGDTGDAVAARVNAPAMAYYDGIVGSSYDWSYKTTNQTAAGGRLLTWPRGKLLGGSAAMNGMYHIWPTQLEVDTWASFVDGGSDKWSWEQFQSAMKAAETFTAPSSAIQSQADIQYVASSRGTSGPIHVSYPGYEFDVVGDFVPTLANLGVAANGDAYNGDSSGAFIATSSINPSNWTRSYSRSGYIDSLEPRSNLAILPNATVTRLIFDTSNASNLTATGVEWASASGAATQTVNANKEVILAAGSIGSPQILMLSGVGPKDVLEAAGVTVQMELPGVGQHLQDHISTELTFETTTQTAASIYQSNPSGATAEFLSYINSATGYVNLTVLMGGESAASTFQQQVASELSSSLTNLIPSTYDTVKAGYELIYNTTLNKILNSSVGQVEILLSLTGSPAGAQSIAIQAALQHPFSQGRIYITSNDAFTAPAIDPWYLAHPADTVILREGLKLARTLAATAPLSSSLGDEVSPGSAVSTDAEWDAWLSTTIGTEYHPSSSCSMLPLEQGGVVDSDLKVYGLGNVRVVDASVFPIDFSTHLQAPVYGLAEQAAKIIRANYNGVGWPSAASTSGQNTSSTSTSTTSTQSAQPDKNNAAMPLSAFNSFALALTVAVTALLL